MTYKKFFMYDTSRAQSVIATEYDTVSSTVKYESTQFAMHFTFTCLAATRATICSNQ